MIEISRATNRWNGGAATWFPVVRTDGRWSAMLNCPKCGRTTSLNNHDVENGAVSPSVVCPYDGCDFHDYVSLIGWPLRRDQ